MTDSVRRILVMSAWAALRTFRSVTAVLFTLVMPIALSFFISLPFARPADEAPVLNVVNEDGTGAADLVLQGLAQAGYKVTIVSRDEAVAAIAAGESSGAVVIPAGFAVALAEGAPRLEVLHAPGAAFDEAVAAARLAAATVAAGEPMPDIVPAREMPRGGVADSAYPRMRSVFGVYLVFAMTALFVRSGQLHKERDDGTLPRVVAAGVPYAEVVVSHILSLFWVGAVQAVVVLTVTGLLGTKWLLSGPLPLLATLAGGLFVSAGLAVGFTGFTRTPNQMTALAGGLPTLLGMLAGAYFPLEVAPASMQSLARLNPMYWVMDALDAGVMHAGLSAQGLPLAVAGLVGVLGMVIGVQGLRRMEF